MPIKIPEERRASLADKARIKSLTKQPTKKIRVVWGALAKHLENPEKAITKDDVSHLFHTAPAHLRELTHSGVRFENQTYDRGFLNEPTRENPGKFTLNKRNSLYRALIEKLFLENGIPIEEEKPLIRKKLVNVQKLRKPLLKDPIITSKQMTETRNKVNTVIDLVEDYQQKENSTLNKMSDDPELEDSGINEKEFLNIINLLKKFGQLHKHPDGTLRTYKKQQQKPRENLPRGKSNNQNDAINRVINELLKKD
ncbi:MAG: hypothetical protein GOV15_02515 [Candidatus Diapherotrites archaeon]|nr:hypothetical protein [Candidatus Diapherotrites archaeon]